MKYSSLADKAVEAMHYDALALAAISTVWDEYIPWTNASLRPSAIQIVLNDILLNRRKMVVELGSGISTGFVAAMLAKNGGRLVTIDHDAGWIEEVRRWLPPEQNAVTTFVHAPLAATTYEGTEVTWYDAPLLRARLPALPPVDLLLIDGPPAYFHEHCLNRGPACEVFRPLLSPAATIILDDLNRAGERHIARRWSDEIGTPFRDLVVEAGIAVWTLGQSRNISQ